MFESTKQTQTRIDTFVSIVAVLDSNVLDAPLFLNDLHSLLSTSYANYEIVLVDNKFNTEGLIEVRALLKKLSCVRVLRLSKRHTADTAIFVGLEAAIGDHVVVLTPGFDPVDVVPRIVELSMAGNDVVQGLSTIPLGGTYLNRLGRTAFYAYNHRFLEIEIPRRATYLTGLTRRAVNSLTNTARNHRYLRHLVRFIGFEPVDYSYAPRIGSGRGRTVRGGSLQAIEMISSYSTHPLRLVAAVGVIAGLLNLLYALYVVGINLIRQDLAEGWTTTSLQQSLMFFLISIVLAVMAEYMGRILNESRREPAYVIMEEWTSDSLITDADRRNVSQ